MILLICGKTVLHFPILFTQNAKNILNVEIMKNKKILFPLLASLSFLFACTSELEVGNIDLSKAEKITFTATDFKYLGATRTTLEDTEEAVRFTWADNDTVGIFPNEGAQVYFPMVSGAGTKTATFTGGGWALKPSSTYAAYYPFISNYHLDQKALKVSYSSQCQEGNASTAHLGHYDYMGAVASTPSEGSVNFDFKHLGSLVRIDITMPYTCNLRSLTLVAPEKKFVTDGTIDLTSQQICVTPKTTSTDLQVSLKEVAVDEESLTATVYFMMAPTDLSGKTLTARVVDVSGVTFEQTFAGKNFEPGVAYSLSSKMQNETLANVYHVEEAGTLPELVGEENKYLISEMKVTGPLNGTDIRFIREMAGRDVTNNVTSGKLIKLDLREVDIVEGGDYYYQNGSAKYSTSNMAVGDYMFYYSNLIDVRLPENIKSIGARAFSDCSGLKSISLPEGVTNIGNYAFNYCTGLTSISLPESITAIGNYAFYYCTGLTSMSFPSRLSTINDYVFGECAGLTSISFPSGLTAIGQAAFGNCDALTEVVFPEGLETIAKEAFYGCIGLRSVSFPEGLTSLGESSFRNCINLTSVILPSSLKIIEKKCFMNCDNLVNISFSEGLTMIDSEAFYDCNALTNVSLPNSLKTIEFAAFEWCGSLANVSFPDGLTTIGNYAFAGCTSLTRIILPENLMILGERSFLGCTGITDVYMTGKLKEIGIYAFATCYRLSNISFPDDLVTIGTAAFGECTSLRSLSLPDGLATVGESAFSKCTSLTSLTLPSGLTTLGSSAFYGCTGLTSVSFPDGLPSIGSSAFYGCTGLTTLSLPSDLTTLEESAFYGCTGLQSISFPDGLSSIGSSAFYGCTGLTTLSLPSGLTTLSNFAFQNCTGLTELSIPEGCYTLWQGVFKNSGVTKVILPSTLTQVRENNLTDKLQIIYSQSTYPPSVYSGNVISPDCKVYVPDASVDTYKEAEVWKNGNILPLSQAQ